MELSPPVYLIFYVNRFNEIQWKQKKEKKADTLHTHSVQLKYNLNKQQNIKHTAQII